MKTRKLDLVFSMLVCSALLLGACGPVGIVKQSAGGECPPGYIPVPNEQVGALGSCQLDPHPPLTVTVAPDGTCPPGYEKISVGYWPFVDHCRLILTPTPSPQPQASDVGPPFPTATPDPQAVDVGPPVSTTIWLTSTPIVVHASNPDDPQLQPAIEVVPYCANPGSKLGGVNITYASDNSLHVEDWFSDKPVHVKCTDDVSNPRICFGPEALTFDVLLCDAVPGQNESKACSTLPVTLGSCAPPRPPNPPEPAPPACVHC